MILSWLLAFAREVRQIPLWRHLVTLAFPVLGVIAYAIGVFDAANAKGFVVAGVVSSNYYLLVRATEAVRSQRRRAGIPDRP